MTLKEYLKYIQDVPRPSQKQFEQFAFHVAHAHSWYKHLDLYAGADCIVFLDPLAGGGFDEGHPRLHHTWETRFDYLEKFGHLAYMWRHHENNSREEFSTDYQLFARAKIEGNTFELVDQRTTEVLVLPPEIMKECGFRLYPFACDNDVISNRFENEFEKMTKGEAEHPCRELLLQYYHAELRTRECNESIDFELYWRNLTPAEARDPIHGLSESESDCVIRDYEFQQAWKALEENEALKIRMALDKLRGFLDEAGVSRSGGSYRLRTLKTETFIGKVAPVLLEIIRSPTDDLDLSALKQSEEYAIGLFRFNYERYSRGELSFFLEYGYFETEKYELDETTVVWAIVEIRKLFKELGTNLRKNLESENRLIEVNEDEFSETLLWNLPGDYELRLEYREGGFRLEFDKPGVAYHYPGYLDTGTFVDAYAFCANKRGNSPPKTPFRAALVVLRNFETNLQIFGEPRIYEIVNRMIRGLRKTLPEARLVRWSRNEILVLDSKSKQEEFLNELGRMANDSLYFYLRGASYKDVPQKDYFSSSVLLIESNFEEFQDLSDLLLVLRRLEKAEKNTPPGRCVVTRYIPVAGSPAL